MLKTLTVMLIVALVAGPALADTKNGNANGTSFQRWNFTAPGGDVTVTITWTNQNVATMFHTIVCGSSTAAFVATASTSTHDRINTSTTGIRALFACTIFVTTIGGGATSYRISTRNATDITAAPAAQTLTLIEDAKTGDYAEAVARQTLQFSSMQR